MKLTLWKDNQQIEAKPFGTEATGLTQRECSQEKTEIGYPILPRFFLVTSQSGVKSMTITIDGARERLINQQHSLVECANASWTFRYQNGYSITLRGPLTADVVVQPTLHPGQPSPSGAVSAYTLKLERLQFDAFFHDKYVAVESIIGDRIAESPRPIPPSPGGAIGPHEDAGRFEEAKYTIEHAVVPAEPINAFGIPQATMRCLEVSVFAVLFICWVADRRMFDVACGECRADVRAYTVFKRHQPGASRYVLIYTVAAYALLTAVQMHWLGSRTSCEQRTLTTVECQ